MEGSETVQSHGMAAVRLWVVLDPVVAGGRLYGSVLALLHYLIIHHLCYVPSSVVEGHSSHHHHSQPCYASSSVVEGRSRHYHHHHVPSSVVKGHSVPPSPLS